MEEQIAELAAKLAAVEAKSSVTNTMFAETFYYITIPLMILIHAGFLAYEMGSSRTKNVLTSGVKNILAFAFIIPTFYFFGWWIYWGFPTGLDLSEGPAASRVRLMPMQSHGDGAKALSIWDQIFPIRLLACSLVRLPFLPRQPLRLCRAR